LIVEDEEHAARLDNAFGQLLLTDGLLKRSINTHRSIQADHFISHTDLKVIAIKVCIETFIL
jgi:hypothetical protein